MASSFWIGTGDGVTTDFDVTFPFLDKSHVFAKVAGASATFSWLTTTRIRLSAAPANAARIFIYRTSPTTLLVDFTTEGLLTEADLDTAYRHAKYLAEEAVDTASLGVVTDQGDGKLDAGSRIIKNLSAPSVASDAARLADVQAIQVAAANVPTPTGGDTGKFLGATGAGAFSWQTAPSSPVTLGANSFTALQTITVSTAAPALTVVSTDAGAAAGPQVVIDRNSASPAVSDVLGSILFNGRNSAAATKAFAQIDTQVVDPVNGTEDANLRFWTVVNGTLATTLTLGGGLVVGSAGTDPGAGKVNATGYQKSNVDGLLMRQGTGASYTPLSAVAGAMIAATNHNLGGHPDFIATYLECLTADAGYSAGERIQFNAGFWSELSLNRPIAFVSTSTAIITINNGNAIQVPHRSTGALTAITAANWKLTYVPYRIL